MADEQKRGFGSLLAQVVTARKRAEALRYGALGGDPLSGPACSCSGAMPPLNHVFRPLTRLPQHFCALIGAGQMPLRLFCLAQSCWPAAPAHAW